MGKLAVAVLACLIGFGAYKYKHPSGPRVPDLAYTDVAGQARKLRGTGKPAVIGFWIADCPYCERMMAVLNKVRRDYPEEQVDVVGFYLNRTTPQALKELGAGQNYAMTLAQAQPPTELVAALDKGFAIRGVGRDIYLVDKDGGFRTVDVSDLETPFKDIYPRITEFLEQAAAQ
jgi:thiol-disulfide isomerase/thioredoxin